MSRPEPTVKTVHANGTELAYVEQGSGAPVVLVHGSLGSYDHWLSVVEALAPRYHAIAYSRRYHAPNPGPTEGVEFSYQLHTADLSAFIEALGVAPVHLVGHSYGGFMALLLARRRPELVRTLLLLEPGAYSLIPDTPQGQAIQKERAQQIAPAVALAEKGDVIALTKLLINMVLAPRTFDDLSPDVQAGLLANAPTALAAFRCKIPPPPFSAADAAALELPALLLGGSTSPPEFGLVLDELERCMPNTERAQVEAGHALILENPEAVSRALLAFLRRHDSR